MYSVTTCTGASAPCPTFPQLAHGRDRILAVQSFSKPYAMTGWRVGYLMAPQAVLDRLAVLHSHAVTCAPAMIQAACLAALDWDPEEMARAYETRRGYICRRLEAMGLPCARPEGAFYVFPSIGSRSSEDFLPPPHSGCRCRRRPRNRLRRRGVRAHVLLLLHGTSAGGHGPAGAIFAAEPMSISIMCTPTSGPLHAIEKGESP